MNSLLSNYNNDWIAYYYQSFNEFVFVLLSDYIGDIKRIKNITQMRMCLILLLKIVLLLLK